MKTEHRLARAGIIVTAVGILIGALVALFVYFRGEYVQQNNRRQEQESRQREVERQQIDDMQKRIEAIPQPEFLSVRYEDGYTYLTFRNTSSEFPLAVTSFSYVISDPGILQRIERKHPKPDRYTVGAPNNEDEVGFREGRWANESEYEFQQSVGYHIAPNGVNDFRLGIVNPKWAGERFIGTLTITYAGNRLTKFYDLRNVTIDGKRSP